MRGRTRRNKRMNLAQGFTLDEALCRKNPAAAIAVGIFCALGLALNVWFGVLNSKGFGLDYKQFYAASHLAGTGHVYDPDALLKAGATGGMSSRLPVVLYGHKLFSGLPRGVARAMWTACTIVAMLAFAAFWPGTWRWLMWTAVAWSTPAALAILYGQDSSLWLMFAAIGLFLMERKRPWSAGVAFSLCICKFHLAVGIPILLVAQKRWKTLIAGAIATAVLLACCFSIEGPQWPIAYWRMSRMEGFDQAVGRMPNFHGIASWLPWAAPIQIALTAALVLILWLRLRATNDLGAAGAVVAAGGLVLSPHAYAYDLVLLIPLTVVTIQRPTVPRWLKRWAFAMLSPLPMLLLLTSKPWLGQVSIAAFVVTAIVAGRADPLSPAVARGGVAAQVAHS